MTSFAKKSLIFLIILLSLILVIFFAGPYIVVYSAPSVIKEFCNRDFTFDKFKYNPFKCTLYLENVKLANGEENLFSIKSFFVDINLGKTICFNPTISKLSIDSPATYVIKNSDFDYQLPQYFPPSNKQTDDEENEEESSFDLFKLKFAVQDVSITNCNILMADRSGRNEKMVKLLTNADFILPGISSSKEQTLNPRLTGYIFEKKLDIHGTSCLDNKEFVSTFDIKLDKFDITDICSIIPEIEHVKLVSGIVTATGQLSFRTGKSGKPQLNLTCQGQVTNLKARDTKLKKTLVDKVCGNLKISNYDILKGDLRFEYINVNSGVANVSFSENSYKSSCIFTVSDGGGEPFYFGLDKLNVKNVVCSVNDVDHNQILPIKVGTLSISKLYTYGKDPFEVNGSFSCGEIVQNITATVSYNMFTNQLDCKSLSIRDFAAHKVNLLRNLAGESFFATVSSANCQLSLAKNILSGSVLFDVIDCAGNFGSKITVPKCSGKINQFKVDLSNGKTFVDINSIDLKNGTVRINDKIKITNGNLSIEDSDFAVDLSNKSAIVKLTKDFKLKNISCRYTSDKSFNCKLSEVSVSKDFRSKNVKDELNFGGLLTASGVSVSNEEKVLASFASSQVDVDSFNVAKNKLNVNSIKLDKPKAVIDIKKDGKLYLLSLLPLEFSGEGDSNFGINLDLVNINDGAVTFSDFSLDKPFVVEISQISGRMENFPSFVYPQGKIELSGVINRRNTLKIETKIGTTGLDGVVKTSDLSLTQLSAYFEKYLGYKVASGNLGLDGKFALINDKLDTNIGLVIKDFGLIKTKNLFPADLTKIIPLLKNNQDIIKLDIPIKGDYNNPNVDFRKIFFDVFYNLLDNSNSRFSRNASNGTFYGDNTYEMLYFNAGSENFASNPMRYLSRDFVTITKNKDKYYQIQAYVDQKIDKQVMLVKKYEQKCESICGFVPTRGSNEERECLEKICVDLFGAKPEEDATNNNIYEDILNQLVLEQSDYQGLSYRRANSIKQMLMDNFGILSSHIIIDEKNIFENPYISGISNNLGFIISGSVR